ncbi:MAG: proprotein convertase P-domain-containing protein [Saprospiraceae bacterium]|nr:proprotein convertase P-domain-containing protein [Saprospiraceae bacterium]
MKNFPTLFTLFICFFSIRGVAQTGDSTCLYSVQFPLNLPDISTTTIDLRIDGATNATLGENGQRICSVHLSFTYEYIGDISIQLTTPNGQSVMLVGPMGFFGATDSTNWDIDFIACNTPAVPDTPYAAVWTSNHPWGMNRHYYGSYYPSSGCLEQLTGSVNGTWKLAITDNQPIDQGILYDFSINFCDDSGIYCNSCQANAGALTGPDKVVLWPNTSNLNLDLSPAYANTALMPPEGEFDYTYTLHRESDGVLLAYDPEGTWDNLEIGTYIICGVSYQTGANTLLPAPNGLLTVAQLRNQLNTGVLPFCADVSSDCIKVVIREGFMEGTATSTSTIGIRNNPGATPMLTPFAGVLPIAHLRVFNSGGWLVWEYDIPEGSEAQPIDLGNAPDGLYFLEMQEPGLSSQWMKIMILH